MVFEEIVSAMPENTELEVAPIPRDWILSGAPEARMKRLAKNGEWTAVFWECSAGRFNWQYNQDEVLVVVSGEVFLITKGGEERRFGPGDVGIFPAGTVREWRIPTHLRMIAVLRQPRRRPIAFALSLWNKFLCVIGLAEESRLGRAVEALLVQNVSKFTASDSGQVKPALARSSHAS